MPHGGYFQDDFASRFWLPLISDDTIVSSHDPLALVEPAWYTSLAAIRFLWIPWLGWLFIAIALLMFVTISTPEKRPAIVAILPADSFGPDCRLGFSSAVQSQSEIVPIILDGATLAEMKADRMEVVDSGLRNAFAKYHVIGVVGPPITECALAVTSTIAEIDPKVPVVLTSAVSGNDPMWALLKNKIPLFRVGSDISQRAKEVQELLKALLSTNKRVVFLIEGQGEDSPRSFGLRFFDELDQAMNYFSHIAPEEYQRIVFPAHQVESCFDQLKAPLSDPNAVVFLLGVDYELKSVVEHFYRQSTDFTPKARIIGWMNAHMLDKLFRSGSYHADLLLDISDFSRSNARRIPGVPWQEDLTKRDSMNYYDSTLVLLESWKKLQQNKDSLTDVAEFVARADTVGIGGQIHFDSTGQNARPLIFLRYSYSSKTWAEISVNAIVYPNEAFKNN